MKTREAERKTAVDRNARHPDLRAVCKRCHMVMDDCEPFVDGGEFFHKTRHSDGTASKCPNAGKTFFLDSKEVEPFTRKRTRRAERRAGAR